ncbi:MAG: entericidin A/B family lipoprotein [bacterium]|nr:entericidin A/B family lipoprotein [bacterium]MDI1337046.1 entericidin A/B family lipoprotein [Lacunisphaera sp.]
MKTLHVKQTNLRLLTVLALVLGALAYSGCQTMKGAGKDIENAGEHIQDAAKK